MMRYPTGRAAARLAMLLLMLWLPAAAGCAAIGDRPSPERMLSLTVSGLKSTDRIVFSGRAETKLAGGMTTASSSFQGEIKDHGQLRLSAVDENGEAPLNVREAEVRGRQAAYNPVALLDRIEHADKTVTVDRNGLLAGREATIVVELSAAAAQDELASRLRAEFDRAAAAARQQADGQGEGAANRQGGAELTRALDAEIAQSRRQLEAILGTLSVSTRYRIAIDRTRYLPRAMEVATAYTYTAGGRQREERSDVAYRFESFGD